jgi:hypothetical protein
METPDLVGWPAVCFFLSRKGAWAMSRLLRCHAVHLFPQMALICGAMCVASRCAWGDTPAPSKAPEIREGIIIILDLADAKKDPKETGALGRILLSGPKSSSPVVVWDGTAPVDVGLKKLAAALKKLPITPGANVIVAVHADRKLRYAPVWRVLDTCRDAGFARWSLRVGRPTRPLGLKDFERKPILLDVDPIDDVERKADITVPGVVNPDAPVGNDGPGKAAPGAIIPQPVGAARSSTISRKALEEAGGTKESEAAVAAGLQWLIRVQAPDGRWKMDGNFKDKGQANDIAGTAFGLLPFLAAGKAHKAAKDNAYDKQVEKGLLFLLGKQDQQTGSFGGTMYTHALATRAVVEAYDLTQDPALRLPAQMAIDHIIQAQHEAGGWRYAPHQAGDMSVTGWQIRALKTAQQAGLQVPKTTFRKAIGFVDSCCDPSNEGYGYIGPGSSPTMSAVGLMCRQHLESWGPKSQRLHKAVRINIETSPLPAAGKPPSNMYYYYYATQVMQHLGGEKWQAWNEKVRESLIKAQDRSTDPLLRGSWDPTGDPHGAVGGRLMRSSLALLTLEVYYRHLPVQAREREGAGDKKPADLRP